MTVKIPFQERKTKLRGIMDLMSGCYPGFLFGRSVGNILPVFHFHDVTEDYLEPYLIYLSENGYETVTSEALGRFVRDGVGPGAKKVVLCFDDAWTSLWTVVAPLLRKYGMTAITYAVAGRIVDADKPRSDEDVFYGSDFATWPELKVLNDEGVVDVQAHTYSHAMMFCSDEPAGFIHPGTITSLLSMPAIKFGSEPVFLNNNMLGAPLFPVRSRMSDAVRYLDDENVRKNCIEYVRKSGGAEFFKGDYWQEDLMQIVRGSFGRMESAEERESAVLDELVRSREVLAARLKSNSIRQVCFPWGVCGDLAGSLVKKAGYETAVADELRGKRFVEPRGNPYRIMRLKHQYIFCLPGNGRKTFLNVR